MSADRVHRIVELVSARSDAAAIVVAQEVDDWAGLREASPRRWTYDIPRGSD